jgi:indolepyruvate ferredoxin oxidoreductase beta subunit
MPVLTGQAEYPKDLIAMMREKGFSVQEVDGLRMAEEAGSSKAVNLVLMGVLSKYFSFPQEAWQEAIDACVPPKVLELNRKAFAMGQTV